MKYITALPAFVKDYIQFNKAGQRFSRKKYWHCRL